MADYRNQAEQRQKQLQQLNEKYQTKVEESKETSYRIEQMQAQLELVNKLKEQLNV